MILLALLAIILPITLLVGFKMSARIGMTISALVVAAVAFLAWQMTPLAIGASALQGLHRATTIALILFGAITLLKTMEKTGAMTKIRQSFSQLSGDMRIQTVLVAFSFLSLLEGVSGFGTPAIITAPLLIILGFQPLAAAALALLGDTVACTFGAVGTPLIVGMENVPGYSADLAWLIGVQVSTFDLIIATLLPLGLISLLVISFSRQARKKKIQSILEVAPWAVFLGASYSVTVFFAARLIGPEFPAIIGGAVSLIAGIVSIKTGFLIPKNIWRHHATSTKKLQKTIVDQQNISTIKAWLPYGLVIVILLLTRAIKPIKEFLTENLTAGWQNILGFESINSNWEILYSPGTILLITALISSLVISRSLKPALFGARAGLESTLHSMLALIPTLIMVQIFSNSGLNLADLPSMPGYIAETLAATFGKVWAFFAPFLGGLGAFIAGSITVSNLTMGSVQAEIASSTELPLILVLALQTVGAAAGNTIAIHNVVGASTVTGLHHREGLIIRKLLIPTGIYLLIAGIIGLIITLI